MLRSLVIVLFVNTLAWLGISYLNTYESYIVGTLAMIAVGLIVIVILIVSFISAVIKWLIHKKITATHKRWLLLPVIILAVMLATKFSVNQFIPDYVGRINREINRIVVDQNIPPNDSKEIINLAKTLSKDQGIRISYYQCDPRAQEPNKEESSISIGGPKESNLCKKGDILLEIRGGYYVSPLGSERRFRYFLLRKVDNKWQVIEDLGSRGWIS